MTLTATIGAMAITGQPAYAEPVPSNADCSEQTVTVTLSDTDTTEYTIAGQLCLQTDALRGTHAVMLMVSGLTYDRSYFNNAYYPTMYSWVYSAVNRGYSTFNIDRLGVGSSSHPAADLLTIEAHAHTVGQIVEKLRAGDIGGRAFTTVIGIGHSLGAQVLQSLAGANAGSTVVPDYLIFSAWLHTGNLPAISVLASSLHDVSADSVLSSAGDPTGYQTTIPGTRETIFYHTDGASSAVIAMDETTKQTNTAAERTTLIAARASSITSNITVPVALSVGEYDTLQCDESTTGLSCASAAAILARETQYYGAQACLTTFIVEDTGHSVTQHYKAIDSYNFVNTWVDDNLINYASQKDSNGCIPTS